MSSENNAFNSKTLRSEFILTRNYAAFFLCAFFIIDWLDFGKTGVIFKAFVLLGIVGAVSKAYWDGTTIISIKLQSNKRWWFQIAVSILTPFLLLLILLKDATDLDLYAAVASHFEWSIVFVMTLIACLSWSLGNLPHKEHPFRGFIGVSTVLFFLTYIGSKGITFGTDEYEYEGLPSKESQKAAVELGSYAAQFLLYIAISYASILARMKKDNHPFIY